MIRDDFVISYWVLAWFVLYMLRVIPYNPYLALVILLCVVTVATIYMFYEKAPLDAVLKFVAYHAIIKLIPLAVVWRHPMRPMDYTATFVLFTVYSLWMFYNRRNPLDMYNGMFLSQMRGIAPTRLSAMMDEIGIPVAFLPK